MIESIIKFEKSEALKERKINQKEIKSPISKELDLQYWAGYIDALRNIKKAVKEIEKIK